MSFINENFKIYYSTDNDDIVKDFYYKALSKAVLYRRATGFFSSSSLILISKGIEALLSNEGKMELLVSPNLSQEDIEAIKNGYENRKNIIYSNLLRNFDFENIQFKDQYNFLAWLIYENRLDIKIVVRKDFLNYGIFHDKFGLIYDKFNNKIGFHGSMNESETAMLDNYESINAFFSWEDRDLERINHLEVKFNNIWNNKNNNWETFEFPEALKERILKFRTNTKPIIYIENNYSDEVIKEVKIPDYIVLRDYQKEAIKNWIKNEGKGIFEMATGTGKTITAISAMVKLIEQYNKNKIPCGILIIVPYKVLLEQWDEVLNKFNITAIKCYESKSKWYNELQYKIEMFNSNYMNNLFIITTNSTFREEVFQNLFKRINKDFILCIDEMHHCATDAMLSLLPNFKFKLGLSATLNSFYNENNIKRLIDYFENGIIFQFPLQKAIKDGYLTPYYYYPIFVDLTDDEKEEYFQLTKKIGKIVNLNKEEQDCQQLEALLIKRAKILTSAENKLKKLEDMKDIIKDTYFNIFYCGDKINNDEKFIEKVNRILRFKIGIKTHTFTAEENLKERNRILNDFASGDLQALTAIRCLDEGVDIPQLRRAFILSSSSNPKEFIQRRGRVLRKFEGKEYAEIYDFFVVPTLDKEQIKKMDIELIRIEQKIIEKEFKRFEEFAELAINNLEAYNKILQVWNMYSLII
ncbi:MAG: phosphorothioation system restriction enzyme [Caloramator sp.]|jgi:superfamily II DNA or RNA helicase|uniref:DEAD/DEAH box helicase family protein n=1 Tax=Caloramator sp. TaxID=1871330 RepID=UPI001D741369|nr:DEAD/DEAH box helicase family protein [Caloramator sp.]MBZ4662714.1 phosphorothioation system restriction enzyme [Caloramator sp.]